MNDEQFEATMECLRDELADKLRARDTAQREALARVEAERDTAVVQMQNIRKERDAINKELGDAGFNLCIAQQQLAEAVGLLREVNSQRFTTLATVEIIESFIGRHSQTFHDRAQAEHQEAQGAQAGGERAAFEGWYRRTLSPGATFNKNPDGSYESGNCQGRWLTWQARAALATQPAAGEPVSLDADDLETFKLETVFDSQRGSTTSDTWNRAITKVQCRLRETGGKLVVAPPAAAHGDEAPGTVRVTADWLKTVHRDLDACQKVIWLAGCRPRVPGGFDPAYCKDAQERLKEIDEQIARADATGGAQHA